MSVKLSPSDSHHSRRPLGNCWRRLAAGEAGRVNDHTIVRLSLALACVDQDVEQSRHKDRMLLAVEQLGRVVFYVTHISLTIKATHQSGSFFLFSLLRLHS